MINKNSAIHLEGALFHRDFIESLTERNIEQKIKRELYSLTGAESLKEKIHRSWNELLLKWNAWSKLRQEEKQLSHKDWNKDELDHERLKTKIEFLSELFSELGYSIPNSLGIEKKLNSNSYKLDYIEDNQIPLLFTSVWEDFDSQRNFSILRESANENSLVERKVTAHSLMQEYLNAASEHLWGVISNGKSIRLLRDTASLTRQSYIEFDCDFIFSENDIASFEKLYLLCHKSVFLLKKEKSKEIIIELWHKKAMESGIRALDKLKIGVSKAIEYLASGFISDYSEAGERLRAQLESGECTKQEFYRQSLRWIYRLVFLFVAEDRNLLHGPKAANKARELYKKYYSTERLRIFATNGQTGSAHFDLWLSFKLITQALGSEEGLTSLALPALGGFLFSNEATSFLNDANVSNEYFLNSLRSLCFTEDDKGTKQRVNWGHLGAEELGGVYESLLPLIPNINFELKRVSIGAQNNEEFTDERKVTGAHYTPTRILNSVLDFALKASIEDALEKGKTAKDKEKELFKLRILDPACGSGHFLVAAAHRLGLEIAKLRTGDDSPPPLDLRMAVREVIRKCIYGLDVNPMAIDLCRVALWMESMEAGKPLTFLEHHIRVGDALLGVPTKSMCAAIQKELSEEIAKREKEREKLIAALGNSFHLPEKEREAKLKIKKQLEKEIRGLAYELWPSHIPNAAYTAQPEFKDPAQRGLSYLADNKTIANNARDLNKKQLKSGVEPFMGIASEDLAEAFNQLSETDVEDAKSRISREKEFLKLKQEKQYLLEKLRADLWCAAFFWQYQAGNSVAPTLADLHNNENLHPEKLAETKRLADIYNFFHLELEWPEVFKDGGFHCVLGNPPFLGGSRISSNLGNKYLNFLKVQNRNSNVTTDLCAYFFTRYFMSLKLNGNLGFIATSTIAQGYTKDASLTPIVCKWRGIITNAITSTPWEGMASLQVSVVHIAKEKDHAQKTINGIKTHIINEELSERKSGNIFVLVENAEESFQGSFILGRGFTLEPKTELKIMQENLVNENKNPNDILFPYITGDDLNTSPAQEASRYVINFFDWPLRRAGNKEWDQISKSLVNERKHINGENNSIFFGIAAPNYTGSVAADYPSAINRVEKLVKPEREENIGKNTIADNRGKYWWKYASSAKGLYNYLNIQSETFAIARVSAHCCPTIINSKQVFSDKIVVLGTNIRSIYIILQSHFHELWMDKNCSTLGKTRTYSPSSCFETFPFPRPSREQLQMLNSLGEKYLAQRKSICLERNIGLTKVYNLFHNQKLSNSEEIDKQNPPFDDIYALRNLHKQINEAVLAAYQWQDIELCMDFYEGQDAGKYLEKGEFRYTPSPAAREQILERLSLLNNERKKEEEQQLLLGKEIKKSFAYFDLDEEIKGTERKKDKHVKEKEYELSE
ncbi:Eco57I restriction-modification methylase domain-containing protein [Fluviispira vulneris]|uniref:Eco57I restriction-modification methylase domain-containing protein n=1 Tax=Fluviispira vulneris TaxID=2763012 RepID=UPI001648E566|nr:DNA methyltransferase [Fluviispira vulneris]